MKFFQSWYLGARAVAMVTINIAGLCAVVALWYVHYSFSTGFRVVRPIEENKEPN